MVLEKNGNVIVYGGFNGGGVASMNIKTAIPLVVEAVVRVEIQH